MAMVTQSLETMNKIGIYILNYNGIYWLKKNINMIISESAKADIIVIDNNSTDNSIKYLSDNYPEIQIKRNNKNYGFSQGYNNILLKEEQYEYFILINNDVEVTKNWIDPMLEILKNKNIGIVQPKILSKQQKNKFDYAGAAGGFLDILGLPFCRGRILHNIEYDKGQYDCNTPITWASGCCFMIKTKLFQELNGFDEDLFMHQEEIDLCWRAHDRKSEVYYCYNSVVYHVGGGSLKYTNPIKSFFNHRNNLLIIIKNMKLTNLIVTLPIRIIIDYLLIILYVFESIVGLFQLDWNRTKINSAKSIIQAHIALIKLVPKFILKRKAIKKNILSNKFLLIEYYLKRNKTFKELK